MSTISRFLLATLILVPLGAGAQVRPTPRRQAPQPPQPPQGPQAPRVAPRPSPTPRAQDRMFEQWWPDAELFREHLDLSFREAFDTEEMRATMRDAMRDARRQMAPLARPEVMLDAFPVDVPSPRIEWDAAPLATPMPHIEWETRPLMDLAPRVQTPRAFPMEFPGSAIEMTRPRAPWLSQDPGDSLYRQARELLNGGEYRRAVASFRELATRMPTSGYAADAHYWWAFALYRIGGTDELRLAIEVLDTQKAKYPGAKMLAQSDALSLRIRGALAARGDAAYAAQLRTAAADSALRCDREEQSVRAEALNALVQADPSGAMPVLQKMLARKDSCSAPLRRTAVFLVGSRSGQPGNVALLSQVARTDPSLEVRASALEWLARAPGDEALATLEEVARDGGEEQVQRAAVRALVAHPSARARQAVRTLVERDATPERLRLEALGAFSRDRSTSEDIAWMRTLYGRVSNARVRSRIVSTLSSIGGADVDAWLLTMARNPEESSESRRYAIRRVGKTLPIAELGKLYDSSAERPIRETLIETLGQRPEGEATDKLIDIVKTGTDPHLRSRAISALSSKKDPRTLRLLMEIIDK